MSLHPQKWSDSFKGGQYRAYSNPLTTTHSISTFAVYDQYGNVAQTTDGVGYETEYAYNLSGAMVEQRYPSGRVVKNVLDASGDLSMVQSARCMDAAAGTDADCAAQAGLWNYAKNLTYNPAGAVTSMQLGNGRWESTAFNSRLQPTQIALGRNSKFRWC
ncbi:MAG: RHS repeat protein [Acidobacteria bacterium]|nr:RHS repeat protein [Acidobacteriota bacterium]